MKKQASGGSPTSSSCKPVQQEYRPSDIRRTPSTPLAICAVSLHHDFSEDNVRLKDDDPEQDAYTQLFAADKNHDPNLAGIKEALEYVDRERKGCHALAMFSLWTTSCSRGVQALLAQYSRKFPILIEWFDGHNACTRIVVNGMTDFQAQQTIARSEDRSDGDGLYGQLGEQLSHGKRLWIHPHTGHRFLLLICGEINVVLGSRNSKVSYQWDPAVVGNDPLKRFNIHSVLNPSHTRFGPQAVRDKQAYLGRLCGALVSCNNTYETLYWEERPYNSWATNWCWRKGMKVDQMHKGKYVRARWLTLS